MQTAALQTLSRFDDAEVAEMIVDAWHGFQPQGARRGGRGHLRPPRAVGGAVGGARRRNIAPCQLDPARIQFLLAHPDDEDPRGVPTIARWCQARPAREVVSAYRDVLTMEGDVPRGRAVFKRECTGCHKLEGVGHDLGLPLQNIKNRGPEGILLNMLDPNREVNPTYLNYTVVTEDGRMITGVITAETATSITLTRAEGESDTVLRTNIEELRSSELSIVISPKGFRHKAQGWTASYPGFIMQRPMES